MTRENELARRAAALLGETPAQVEALHGGDLSDVVRLRFADGRSVVAKGGPAPPVEAAMLGAIAEAGAPCPSVVAADQGVLVMSDLGREGGLGPDQQRALGAAVRTLHDQRGGPYGWTTGFAFGRVVIDNSWSENWPAFWAERRLTHGLAEVPPPLARRVERLATALPDRLPARPAPALLHGDLWSGNVFAGADGSVALIDPACCFGDAEVDLAMLSLLGAPGAGFFESYGALEPGAGERRPIYQLWPALVHLRLFGAGYARLVGRLLDEAGV